MEEIAKEGIEDKVQKFLQWMQVNGAVLKSCYLKPSAQDAEAGLGLYTRGYCSNDEVLMVIPLVLAITPMTVLQDPLVGHLFGTVFADGQVDDRHVMILYLMVERALGCSSFWEPYLNMLPKKFGTSVLFSEDELLELKGTSLYNATKLQKAALGQQFTEKVKPIVESILESVQCTRREVTMEDYLWANFIFWTRALTIPCPHSMVCPPTVPTPVSSLYQKKQEMTETMGVDSSVFDSLRLDSEGHKQHSFSSTSPQILESENALQESERDEEQNGYKLSLPVNGVSLSKKGDENYQHVQEPPPDFQESGDCQVRPPEMVEGLVPGIDFCNHAVRGVARWEVDGSDGSITGISNSMYLVTGPKSISANTEITICYGNKSNEELLYLYGFVLDNNPDDYLMVHFPIQALEDGECPEAKSQLLENQELPLRWLLTSSILQGGYLSERCNKDSKPFDCTSEVKEHPAYRFSWSGQRKPPPGVRHQVFPEDMMGALRIIAMTEEEIQGVQNLLEELSESSQRLPSTEDVKAAVWEVCGDVGALQLLQDLLTSRVLALEEGTGPEYLDSDLLAKHRQAKADLEKNLQQGSVCEGDNDLMNPDLLSRNKRACVVYRKGQKHLATQFLKEVEYALERWIS
ncbi:hypothetical protein MPTK1_6g01360 [Marchantia polymorpha subsp. ruderalis]|uniref:SET domain-containing protein n=2 Tax=Marchantia polymorpha TaxID=3197 RepID=A0AAF6BMD0_MARPO|nr:hypothetical protein MARPO_0052s0068 [Marchantia polymorpha]PTQ38284.1 hypothetical protein MARPO_0052s0068 [Marchantia polymorpha]BBN13163.1 hypothetical protein Mp_6g01360 [Marchantia polymorpha subsp. ruderalis]BBN13164.1 hypothetical protein Mp_6g01360 [Marchantia polymorpha subsp. ruderalis]|eukprot:PTQ38283.1 hypothetical protein MARPO_0052s0068 [Marchantia polymorpha]